MSRRRRLTPLSSKELRDLILRRGAILAAEEQAAVQAALDQANPDERERLLVLLRRERVRGQR